MVETTTTAAPSSTDGSERRTQLARIDEGDPVAAYERRLQKGLADVCLAAWVSHQLGGAPSDHRDGGDFELIPMMPAAGSNAADGQRSDEVAAGVVEAAVREFVASRMRDDTREGLAELATELRRQEALRTAPTQQAEALPADDAAAMIQALIMGHLSGGNEVERPPAREATPPAPPQCVDTGVDPIVFDDEPSVAASEAGGAPRVRSDSPRGSELAASAAGSVAAELKRPTVQVVTPGGDKRPTDSQAGSAYATGSSAGSGRATPAGGVQVVNRRLHGPKEKKPLRHESSDHHGPFVPIRRMPRPDGLPASPSSAALAAAAASPSGPPRASTPTERDLHPAASGDASPSPLRRKRANSAIALPTADRFGSLPHQQQSPSREDDAVRVESPVDGRRSYASLESEDRAAAHRIAMMTEDRRTLEADLSDADVVDVVELGALPIDAPAPDPAPSRFRVRGAKALPEETAAVEVQTIVLSDSDDSSSTTGSTTTTTTSSSSTGSSDSSSDSSSSSTTDTSSSSSSGGRRRRRGSRRSRSRSPEALAARCASQAVEKFVERVVTSPLWAVPFQVQAQRLAQQHGVVGGLNGAYVGNDGELRVRGIPVDAVPSAAPGALQATAAVPATAPSVGGATATDAKPGEAAAPPQQVSEQHAKQQQPRDDPRVPSGVAPMEAPRALPAARLSAWLDDVGNSRRQLLDAAAASHVAEPPVPDEHAQRRIDEENGRAPGISIPSGTTLTSSTNTSSFDNVHGTHRFAWPPTRQPQLRLPARVRRAMAGRGADVTSDENTSGASPTTMTSTSPGTPAAAAAGGGVAGADGGRDIDMSTVTSRSSTSPEPSGPGVHVPRATRAHAAAAMLPFISSEVVRREAEHDAAAALAAQRRRAPGHVQPRAAPSLDAVDSSFQQWASERFSYGARPGPTTAERPTASGNVWPPPWQPPVTGAHSASM